MTTTLVVLGLFSTLNNLFLNPILPPLYCGLLILNYHYKNKHKNKPNPPRKKKNNIRVENGLSDSFDKSRMEQFFRRHGHTRLYTIRKLFLPDPCPIPLPLGLL